MQQHESVAKTKINTTRTITLAQITKILNKYCKNKKLPGDGVIRGCGNHLYGLTLSEK